MIDKPIGMRRKHLVDRSAALTWRNDLHRWHLGMLAKNEIYLLLGIEDRLAVTVAEAPKKLSRLIRTGGGEAEMVKRQVKVSHRFSSISKPRQCYRRRESAQLAEK